MGCSRTRKSDIASRSATGSAYGTSMMPSRRSSRAFEDARIGNRVANVVVRQDRHIEDAVGASEPRDIGRCAQQLGRHDDEEVNVM